MSATCYRERPSHYAPRESASSAPRTTVLRFFQQAAQFLCNHQKMIGVLAAAFIPLVEAIPGERERSGVGMKELAVLLIGLAAMGVILTRMLPPSRRASQRSRSFWMGILTYSTAVCMFYAAIMAQFVSGASAAEVSCDPSNRTALFADPAYTFQMVREGEGSPFLVNVDTSRLTTVACAVRCCQLVLDAISQIDGCRGLTLLSEPFKGLARELVSYSLEGPLRLTVPVTQAVKNLTEISKCLGIFWQYEFFAHMHDHHAASDEGSSGYSGSAMGGVAALAGICGVAAIYFAYKVRQEGQMRRAGVYAALIQSNDDDGGYGSGSRSRNTVLE